eukprot:4513242-Amphidinium_carterae.1
MRVEDGRAPRRAKRDHECTCNQLSKATMGWSLSALAQRGRPVSCQRQTPRERSWRKLSLTRAPVERM